MIATLTGNNSYLLKRRLQDAVSVFASKYGELAVDRIDAGEVEPQSILDSVQSLPFLAEKRLVVLRDLSANKAASELVEQIISSVSNSTELIIYDPSPDKRTAYFKVLKSKTELEEYPEIDAPALAKWLVEEAKKQDLKLNLADANYLIERVGVNQELVANELAKLGSYNPQISRDNIDLLTVKNPQSKIFDLLDAAFAGNKRQALELYAEQRAQKVEPQAIMALVAWQLRLLALVKAAPHSVAATIAKDAGVSPYPVIKAQKLATKIDADKLNKMVNQALEIDRLSKTKAINLDEALKNYITVL